MENQEQFLSLIFQLAYKIQGLSQPLSLVRKKQNLRLKHLREKVLHLQTEWLQQTKF
jgi:hypothetical protein